MRSDGSNVKRRILAKEFMVLPCGQGRLTVLTKMHKGRFYIGVMRTDGKGEDCLQKIITKRHHLGLKWAGSCLLQRNESR